MVVQGTARLGIVVLPGVIVALLTGGCAALDSRPLRFAPRVCPDGAPLKWLQDPGCGRACGWSCLPDRWDDHLTRTCQVNSPAR